MPASGASGKSHRAADLGKDPGNEKRLVENRADPGADRENGLGVEARIDDDSELVAAETRDEVRVVGKLQQALTGLLQHAVADPVPIEIVDGLEAVEIEHADDEFVVLRPRALGEERQAVEELAPVRQIGQAVDIGEAEVFVAEASGLDLAIDHGGELPGADDQDVDHRDRDQQQVQSDGDLNHVAAGEQKDHERRDHRAGQGQRRRTHMHQAEDAADDRDADEEQDMAMAGGVAIRKQAQRPRQECKAEYAAQQHRRPQGAGGGLRLDHAIAAPQPDQATDRARADQDAGKDDRQAHGRDAMMRERQRNRIHAQDEVEQRDLPRERRELRSQQFVIVGIDPE